MFSRKELKESAKAKLSGRWGGPVLLTFIFFVINIITSFVSGSIPGVSEETGSIINNVLNLLIMSPLTIGMLMYYLEFIDSDSKVDISTVLGGFDIFGKSLGIYLWQGLWVFLWSLLLIIPGIIKSLAYSQSYYLIAENSNIGIRDALKISMKMTQGYKGDILIMGLSFIGWSLLCILTLGIGFLWLQPYMTVSYANMYRKLKQLSLESGACTYADFGMDAPIVQETTV